VDGTPVFTAGPPNVIAYTLSSAPVAEVRLFSDFSLLHSKTQNTSNFLNPIVVNQGLFAYGGGFDDEAFIHDLETGTLLSTFQPPDQVVGVDINKDFLAIAGGDTIIRDLNNFSLVHQFGAGFGPNDVAMNDNKVAIALQSGGTEIRDLTTGNLDHHLQTQQDCSHVDMDNDHVAFEGGNNEVFVHDPNTGNLIYTLTNAFTTIQGLALNSQFVAYAAGQQNEVFIHNLSNGSLNTSITSISNPGEIDMNETHLAIAQVNGDLFVFDLTNFSQIQTITDTANHVSLSPTQ